MKIKRVLFLFLMVLLIFRVGGVWAQGQDEEVLEGVVSGVVEEHETEVGREEVKKIAGAEKQLYQKLKVLITIGSIKDQEVEVEVGVVPAVGQPKYKRGDEVILTKTKNVEGEEVFYIRDFVRRNSLFWLFLIFVVLVILIARLRGVGSILGMGVSFTVIFLFLLPQINRGKDPIVVAILSSIVIIPVTFYFSHGLNRKTTVAILGTLLTLVLTGILASFFVGATRLTGYASEEAGFLQAQMDGGVNIRGLLLAGIIVGLLGILDDITVAQAAVVEQIKRANVSLKGAELFWRAMEVGKDHIASMVNTLVLVYAGAALPLLLLFVNNPNPFSEVINYEIVAEEIVRTLVASIGLVAAVPITTFLAATKFFSERGR